ncbi:MAG: sulfatase [Candidatus Sumerlaeota bacterium]|nr:sulfatase [Candidatus Sumerlaeota bacterium]
MAARKAPSAETRNGPRRPNVLILMMDTQGARNMSCYGYRRATTPNLDRIARQGALFLNHFTTAPWTYPAHASLFTGRYESGHGCGAAHEALEPGLPSLPEILTRRGYRTVAFTNNSFAVSNFHGNPGVGFQELHRYSDTMLSHLGPGEKILDAVEPYIPSDDPKLRDKGAFKVAGLAKKWIEDNILDPARKGKAQPFFLFINYMEPHDPYTPPEPFRSRFLDPTFDYDRAQKRRGGQFPTSFGKDPLSLEEFLAQRDLYDGSTACLDHRIGLLIGELEKMGILDDTMVVLTGDHGDALGEQREYAFHAQHGLVDHVLKTPLIVRCPKAFQPGTKCRNFVQINDIFPTILDLLGLDEPEARASIQGESLFQAMKGPGREFALCEAQRPVHSLRSAWWNDPECDVRWCNQHWKAARGKRYKYIWSSVGQDMLFDVAKDPDERFNIIQRRPDIAKRMFAALEEKLLSFEQRYFPDTWSFRKYDRNLARRMEAWGLFQPMAGTEWATAKK